jgi:hypothetical protein
MGEDAHFPERDYNQFVGKNFQLDIQFIFTGAFPFFAELLDMLKIL